ncbi:MAG: preprotein translocase subunit YajC [Defluviicoccus sp.]|nr:preprotein translocase subunit YajC [Defluviicoccus sp.]MDE0277572.1 preprotein translocase subunit YajC [Defluviicoccus sp.]
MLISPAFAQDGGGLGGIEPLIPLVLIFVVFYFLLIRPQQKKAKAHREMIAGLRRGDRVVTSGGIVGQVQRVIGDSELSVEIAEGVRVRVMRAMVAELVAKPEPSRARDDDYDDDDDEDDDEEEERRARRRRRKRREERSRDDDEDADGPDEDRT